MNEVCSEVMQSMVEAIDLTRPKAARSPWCVYLASIRQVVM